MSLQPEQIKAAKYVIRQAPSGELHDVLTHLISLAGSKEALQENADILGAIKKWIETHKYHIPLPNGKNGMVTENGYAGEDASDFTYYDSSQALTFSIDPFLLTGQVISEDSMGVATCPLRDSLVSSLDLYI